MTEDYLDRAATPAEEPTPWVEDLQEYMETTTTGTAEPLSFGKIAIRRILRDRLTLAAISTIALLVILSTLAGVISTYVLHVNPYKTDLLATFEPPSSKHWLGTDQLGRDQLSRLLYGGRVSLAIGFSAAGVSMTIGVLIGLTAGFFGRFVDDFIMWFINTLQSIPTLFLLLIVVALFSPSAFWLVVILGFLGWTGTSRLVRGEVFSLRERDYVTAARALGASRITLMLRHVLPNAIPIVIVITMIDVGTVILVESALSFLGLGVQPPTATWGNMLSNAQSYFHLGQHLVIFPGLLITITVLCLYLIGDGLRDALDPRLK
jgi:peptide/nickel transport system permease protein